ncbi:MAG: lipocalin-like domain-containing protein [Xanthomonadales bacterium]|nr:lipocalin-like domain-containing protein [Xanthomonadales bacterium]
MSSLGTPRAAAVIGTMTAVLLGACEPTPAPGEPGGLAVLAQSAEGFAQAQPDDALQFPRDHGSHPDYRIEWWYVTANLEDDEGRPYGAQWTLFRFAVQPPGSWEPESPWQSEQVFMAHMAITTPAEHFAFQRYARGGDHRGIAQAGVTARPFAAWLDDWSLRSSEGNWLPLELRAAQNGFGLRLRLESDRPPLLQGEAGFSQKHPDGGGSWYYSQPFLKARGELRIDGQPVPVRGQAWLDREWSSQFLQSDQAGWDWFALHLESGEKLMLFRLRARDGGADFRHGVLIGPDGSRQTLEPSRIGLQPLHETAVAGRSLPLHWRIDLPEIGRSLEVEALHPAQWLDVDFPYWEGVVSVSGESPGSRGRGYLELTGFSP